MLDAEPLVVHVFRDDDVAHPRLAVAVCCPHDRPAVRPVARRILIEIELGGGVGIGEPLIEPRDDRPL